MNYQEIIDNITEDKAKEILRNLDIEFEDRGNYLIMNTVCHHHKDEESSKKLYYYFNNKLFVCYTECGNQSWFKFLKNYYEAQSIEYDWYRDIYDLLIGKTNTEGFKISPINYSIKTYVPSIPPQLPTYNTNVLDCFSAYYPVEWLDDNISVAAMDKYNIKYDSVRNKIIIPHYNINNELVGIRARSLNADDVEQYGKYMPICIEGKWYSHPLSLNAYGFNLNRDNINKYHQVIVCESEKSVLQFENFDLPNICVAVCGSNFNKYVLLHLLKCCPGLQEVVIAFDNEELPRQDKYYNKLRAICEKYNNYCKFSFIYDRKHLTSLKDSPTDCGEEIFRELYKKRIKIN